MSTEYKRKVIKWKLFDSKQIFIAQTNITINLISYVKLLKIHPSPSISQDSNNQLNKTSLKEWMEEVSGSQSNQTQPYLKGVISVNMCTKFEVE